MRIVLGFGILAMLTGCAGRNVRAPAAPEANAMDPGYLDLKAGWRLVVVVPVLKSGGYRLPSLLGQTGGNPVSAGPDFLGYETDIYLVAGKGAEVRIHFGSAEVVQDGNKSRQTSPRFRLFELASDQRYVRLIYLVRQSQADHNMAVVAADDVATLGEVTRMVQAHPDDACRAGARSSCSWVPGGIAVRPEERRRVDGVKRWTAAR